MSIVNFDVIFYMIFYMIFDEKLVIGKNMDFSYDFVFI